MLIRWPLRDVQLSTQRWEISEYEQLCEWLWENHHIVASWTKVLFIHPQHNIVCDLVDVDLITFDHSDEICKGAATVWPCGSSSAAEGPCAVEFSKERTRNIAVQRLPKPPLN